MTRFFSVVLPFCILLGCVMGVASEAQVRAKVKVVLLEKGTGEPIIGAAIKCGGSVYITDNDGGASLPYPSTKELKLSVKSLGYKAINNKTYHLSGESLTIHLSPIAETLQTVNVLGQRQQTSSVQVVAKIEKSAMERGTSLNLGKLLEQIPGVSTISSGSTIAKPVIQGMHSSRILLINNGVRIESQSWGQDHAPEIDHTASNTIEVIKGAEAIRYGYGAMGGVVLFSPSPLAYGHDRLSVSGLANIGYTTNGRGYDGVGTVDIGYKQFGLRLHSMYQKAGDYTTAEYRLNNTGYNTISLSGIAGFENKHITATLMSSMFYQRSGIYYGSQVSDLDQLIRRFEQGRPGEETIKPFSYKVVPPMQQSQHFLLKADLRWKINNMHELEFNASYQNNLRQEFENRKKDAISLLPVQDLKLKTFSTETVWSGRWGGDYEMSSKVGLSAMYQINYNVPGTKQPAFIPNYAALTTGIFLSHRATFWEKLICSAGVRYDFRAQDVKGYTSLSSFKFYNDYKLYSNFTANIAAHYQFTEELDARVNVGWAWRPPDVNELYANGLEHGTYWVKGNKDLTAEHGGKVILSTRYRNSWISVEPSVFYQSVTNYIYDSIGTGINRFHNHPSGKYPKFIYGQDNVRFIGGDVTATIVPLEGLTLCATGEWINARNLSQDAWLPFMPSDRYTVSAEYKKSFGARSQWHSSVMMKGLYVTKQKHFDPQKDLAPDSPDAYFLTNASAEISYDLPNNRSAKLMILGDNIFNTLYKEYTDRFRFFAHGMGAKVSVRTIFTF